MSMKEADRLKVIWQVITGKLRIKEAAAQLFLSRRQQYRNPYLNYKTIEKAHRPSRIMNVGKGNRRPQKRPLDHPARRFLISENSIHSSFVPGQPR
jgi:hypothetical protein